MKRQKDAHFGLEFFSFLVSMEIIAPFVTLIGIIIEFTYREIASSL